MEMFCVFFSRLLVSEDDILKESTKKKFQKIILDYIPEERCDAFNQALMEVGLWSVSQMLPALQCCPLHKIALDIKAGKAHFYRLKSKETAQNRKKGQFL